MLLAVLPLQILLVQLLTGQLLLALHVVHALLQVGCVPQLDHLDLLQDRLLEVDIGVVHMLREVVKFQITQLGSRHLRGLVPWGWEHHMLLLNADLVHYHGGERVSLTIGLSLLEVGGLRGLLEEGVLTLLQDLLCVVRHFKF